MLLTGERQSTRNETFSSVTLSTTDLIWAGMGSNPGLHGERPVTDCVSHDTALNTSSRTLISTDV
jgi:hypothetical protein